MATQASSARAKTENYASKEDVEAQIGQLRDDVSKLVATVTALGKDKAGDAKEKVSAQAEDALNAVNAQASRIEAEVTGRVRERPIMALGIAAAVGFVAAMLARR